MKISLITLHRVLNYGSVLQTYATQKIFENKGYNVEVIDYIPEHCKNKTIFFKVPPNKSWNAFYRLCYYSLKGPSLLLKRIVFNKFIKKHINLTLQRYYTLNSLVTNCPNADIYVSGSDQIWNSEYNGGIDLSFFLDFVPVEKEKISFVSSFGVTKLPDNEIKETKQLIKKYKAISVREDSALEILKMVEYRGGLLLCDPTLLICSEEWDKLIKNRLVKEQYVLLMLLYNEDGGATEYAKKISDQNGFKLVKISWEVQKPHGIDILMTHRSPEDFLSLIKYAEFIVTNSFHGVAFSINFKKQFKVMPRKEYNSRIESLLRITGLLNRFITQDDQLNVTDQPINYDQIELILQKERKKSDDFINTFIQKVN